MNIWIKNGPLLKKTDDHLVPWLIEVFSNMFRRKANYVNNYYGWLLKIQKARNLRKYRASYFSGQSEVGHGPVEIFCEAANCCNIRCIMCPTHAQGWVGCAPVLPLALIEKTKHLFKKALMMHAFGFGEPLMNKELINIIGLAKDKLLWVDFFTNATLLKKEKAHAFVNMGVDNITISFDGGTKETYEKIHEGAKFDVVVENLRELGRLKQKSNSGKPELAINFIAMQINFHEMLDLLELASSFAVTKIYVKTLVVYDKMSEMHSQRKIYEPEKDDAFISEVKKLAAEKGIEVFFDIYYSSRQDGGPETSNDDKSIVEKPKNREEMVCFQPWKTFYIKSDGNVKPCCFYWDKSFMGNLYESTPEEIWNGSEYKALRNFIARGIYPEGCRHCCEFNLRPKIDDAIHIFGRIIANDPLMKWYKKAYK